MSDSHCAVVPRLHFITDTQCQGRLNDVELTRAVLEGGGKLIQYRDKFQSSTRVRLDIARKLSILCEQHAAELIINDRADVASCLSKAGLHLGPTDLPLADARKLLGPARIVGATVNETAHAHALLNARPNYIGIGPFRATSNKKSATSGLGLEGIKGLLNSSQAILGKDLPAIAIGGITLEDVAPLLEAGFHGVAVIGAIAKAECPTSATSAFVEAIARAIKVN